MVCDQLKLHVIKILTVFVTVLVFGPNVAHACPLVHGFVDMNCDQKYKMVFTGDSIVYGVRDTSTTSRGYPGRMKRRYPFATVENLGYPGINSQHLYAKFKSAFAAGKHNSIVNRTLHADIFTIAIGTNDFLSRRPDLTVRNISRLTNLVTQKLREFEGTTPLIVVATLTPNNRVSNGNQSFSRQVNKLLLKQRNSTSLPVYVRFDTMPVRYLNDDSLHPDRDGYSFLANLFNEFLVGSAQELCRARRADTDSDGVYDYFERTKYHTDPLNADTDNDGISDGVEIFTNHTDPLVP